MSKRTKTRLYWLVGSVAGLSLLAALFFVPALTAQDASSFEEERLIRTFRQVYDFIQENYVDEIDPDVLIEGAMKGMFESLEDPYSMYLDFEDMRSLTDTTSGEFGGVGLYINKVRPDDSRPELQEWVEVVSPIEGTPAYRAGMKPRDLIIEIEGESTTDMSIDEVVSRLRGVPDTSVEITVLRNMEDVLTVTLTRAIIEIPTVRYGEIAPGIGYVRIIQFTPRTASKVYEALLTLEDQGSTNMIIDLRTNPGGLLSSAIDTADLFYDDGLVVGTAGRIPDENQAFYAQRGTAVDDDAEIVVLIDGGTASAAEILSGALKDRGRAVLVGETSYGKGSVQQVRSLGNSGFRLTVARYYTPNGTFIDKIGIEPDVTVSEPELSDGEQEALLAIQQDSRVDTFLDSVGNSPSESQIAGFFRTLRSEGLEVNERLVRRLITIEVEARTNVTEVFDLEYDLVLQEALRLLQDGRVQSILDARPEVSTSDSGLPTPRVRSE